MSTTDRLRLVEPSVTLHRAWLESWAEWGPDGETGGSDLVLDDAVESPEGFAAWVARLHAQADRSRPLDPGRVHATYWWIQRGHEMVGSIALRHELNDFLLAYGGHVGYSVRPSARRQGVARWALAQVLGHAHDLGLDRVLLTCDDDNVASARTIEVSGGVLEDVRPIPQGARRRYWIDLPAQSGRLL